MIFLPLFTLVPYINYHYFRSITLSPQPSIITFRYFSFIIFIHLSTLLKMTDNFDIVAAEHTYNDLIRKNDQKSINACIAILDNLDEKTILSKPFWSCRSWLDRANFEGNIAIVKYLSEKYRDSQLFKDYAAKEAEYYSSTDIYRLYCHYFLCVDYREETYKRIIRSLNYKCVDASRELISCLNSFEVVPGGVELYIGKTIESWYTLRISKSDGLRFANIKQYFSIKYRDITGKVCFDHDVSGNFDVFRVKNTSSIGFPFEKTYSGDVFSNFKEFREFVISKYA